MKKNKYIKTISVDKDDNYKHSIENYIYSSSSNNYHCKKSSAYFIKFFIRDIYQSQSVETIGKLPLINNLMKISS